MKNNIVKLASLPIYLFIIQLLVTGCGNGEPINNNPTAAEKKATELKYSVTWIAYKFSEKTPVKGTLDSVLLTVPEEGTLIERMSKAQFAIFPLGVNSKDAGRDEKIRTKFFGNMLDGGHIKGVVNSLNMADSTGVLSLTMNGITHDLSGSLVEEKGRLTFSSNIQIADWQAQNALDSLHKACELLHKGSDDKSILWSEVSVVVAVWEE